jgi:hypothetical protein
MAVDLHDTATFWLTFLQICFCERPDSSFRFPTIYFLVMIVVSDRIKNDSLGRAIAIIFFKWYSGGGGSSPLGTAATNGLLCQPRVIMMIKKLVE